MYDIPHLPTIPLPKPNKVPPNKCCVPTKKISENMLYKLFPTLAFHNQVFVEYFSVLHWERSPLWWWGQDLQHHGSPAILSHHL